MAIPAAFARREALHMRSTVFLTPTLAERFLCQQLALALWRVRPSGDRMARLSLDRCRALACGVAHTAALLCASPCQPLRARRCKVMQPGGGGGSPRGACGRRPRQLRRAHARAVVPKSMARMALRFCEYAMRRRSSSVLEHTILPLADAASTPPELRAQTHAYTQP